MSGHTITRSDLVEAVYRLGIENRESEPHEQIGRLESAELVEAILQEIADALVKGETVKLSSFGAFSVREKGARVGRNPKTLEEKEISPRRVLSFRPSQLVKDHVNGEAVGVNAAE
ncbi:MAG: HU family DNA-binding protein [Neomegalonema sp.]|nr:HU family DNA-binding protein [Neomegalonema sp.]